MSEPERRNYQPPYQSLLVAALHDVVSQMNNGNSVGAWECIKTLNSVAPPEVVHECKADFDRAQQTIVRIKRQTYSPINGIGVSNDKFNAICRKFLYGETRRLLSLYKDSLWAHGYLERFWEPVGAGNFKDLEQQQKDEDEKGGSEK
ncbi:MAG: hypothetical protein ABSG57_04755 [Candidatus Bathyarchaeia archaeon]